MKKIWRPEHWAGDIIQNWKMPKHTFNALCKWSILQMKELKTHGMTNTSAKEQLFVYLDELLSRWKLEIYYETYDKAISDKAWGTLDTSELSKYRFTCRE